jgi:hypothetical protein
MTFTVIQTLIPVSGSVAATREVPVERAVSSPADPGEFETATAPFEEVQVAHGVRFTNPGGSLSSM